jgi:transcriptional regulator with XRE-family HTH domain
MEVEMNKLRMNTQYIDFYLQKNQINKEEFAKRCNLSTKQLTNIYNQKNVDIITAIKVAETLKISTDTFLFMEKYNSKITLTK